MKTETDVARKELGKRIRELRKLKGLTQEELGEKADLSYQFVGEVERGKVNISFDSLLKIARALEIDIGNFFRTDITLPIKIIAKDPLSKLSPSDLHLIKKSLQLLNRTFSKI